MKSKLIASLFVTSALFTSVPAFASGYGPAPSYMPSVGAPSSQRGPSVLTIAAQRNETRDAAYGGTENENAQSGSTVQKDKRTTAFTYH